MPLQLQMEQQGIAREAGSNSDLALLSGLTTHPSVSCHYIGRVVSVFKSGGFNGI